MRIFVNIVVNRKTFVLDNIKDTDTVETIKQRINRNWGIADSCQTILLPSGILQPGVPLSEYNVKDGMMFYLNFKCAKIMEVYIVTPDEAVAVEVVEPYFVMEAKTTFRDMRGYPPEQQILLFNGKELEDDLKLPDYGIQAGDTLELDLRPLAAPPEPADAAEESSESSEASE
mmetsp:Transcript_104785/g.305981  ORF Transcript_104785/g.305981 Transcript_104785/m.305981 type:complete len:173 (-) Transcript_104785:80-598(-)